MPSQILLVALGLATFASIAESCFSSGIGCCGGCGGCGMPPPPPPVCGGGCGAGYGCGQYGCYRKFRAASAKTLQIRKGGDSQEVPEVQYLIILMFQPKLNPDEKFMRCCQKQQLPDSCLSKCSYGTYTRQALQVSPSIVAEQMSWRPSENLLLSGESHLATLSSHKNTGG